MRSIARVCITLLLLCCAAAFNRPMALARALQCRAKIRKQGALIPSTLRRTRALWASEGVEGGGAEESKMEDSAPVAAEEEDQPIMVGPFNLKDPNDWITVFLYGVIAWQAVGIVTDLVIPKVTGN